MKIVQVIQDVFQECHPFNWGMSLFCYGCNLSCQMCHNYNYEFTTDENNIIGNSIELIQKNITPFHDTIIFIGGEPTIYNAKLIETLKWCKDKGLKTKVFTNGVALEVIKQINNLNLCDAWSVDYKCTIDVKPKLGVDYLTDLNYNKNVQESIKNILENKKYLEVRTTKFEGLSDNEVEYISSFVNKSKLEFDVNIQYIMQNDFRKYLQSKGKNNNDN